MTLTDYIGRHYGGNNAAFARANNVHPQQVTRWIRGKFIVIGNTMYSPRRDIDPVDSEQQEVFVIRNGESVTITLNDNSLDDFLNRPPMPDFMPDGREQPEDQEREGFDDH